jgi:hypothetical protein
MVATTALGTGSGKENILFRGVIMEKIIKTDEIKSHYIELLRAFLSQIGDIPDKDLTGLPAPHIPVIGTGYENAKVKMAFYGIETKWWERSMVDFKNKFLTSPETGYEYLTELFTPQNIIKWSKGTFFKYIMRTTAKQTRIYTSTRTRDLSAEVSAGQNRSMI